jgi:pyruvate carboxylase
MSGTQEYSEVFEEGMDEREEQTVHRIRANSSIMQLKKLLGKRIPLRP